MSDMNQTPWWVSLVIQIGVPGVILLVLVWRGAPVVTKFFASLLEKLDKIAERIGHMHDDVKDRLHGTERRMRSDLTRMDCYQPPSTNEDSEPPAPMRRTPTPRIPDRESSVTRTGKHKAVQFHDSDEE